ncbi:MAG: hypothetical protein A3G87_02510 [Omnitrophica bacterium RIFCSPLOWO2_12_FULL_50_11]|nr:MAG: hypothetical protein A3G87_02510 [Omnitrophica bacterium RIFCSPLOWO2_12_FULL_50_11]
MILDNILEHKRREVEALKTKLPLRRMEEKARSVQGPKRSLARALSGAGRVHLICELKKQSPSAGLLREHFIPTKLAKQFESSGASALSVLTETKYFKGHPETLRQIRPATTIPILRKDFLVERYQVYETAWREADAYLLIAMILSDKTLKVLLRLGNDLGLEALVEVHTERELDRALRAGANLVGINSRNLKTLGIDDSVPERLFPKIPKEITTVIESGIQSSHDIQRYQEMGANCFLIGTALMKCDNIEKKMAELKGESIGSRNARPLPSWKGGSKRDGKS